MSDEASEVSEGSDIEVDSNSESVDVDETAVYIERLHQDEVEQPGESYGSGGEAEAESLWKFELDYQSYKDTSQRDSCLKTNPSTNPTPLQAFSKLFDDAMWNRLVEQTNLYAEQQLQPDSASKHRWITVGVTEMKTFIGLCLTMGLLPLPDRHKYWRQTKWLFTTQIPRAMSRDRFEAIWHFLHLEDNQGTVDKSDNLWKVRWFLSHLAQNFQANGCFSVNDGMLKHTDRLVFRQYPLTKPSKEGVKVWVMAEGTTGYVLNYLIMAGGGGYKAGAPTHRVVRELATPLLGCDLQIYMDDFFPVAEDAKKAENQTNGTGDGSRKEFPDRNLSHYTHHVKVAHKTEWAFQVFKNTDGTFTLSKCRDSKQKNQEMRKTYASTGDHAEAPSSSPDARRLDFLDHTTKCYSFDHRSTKWWRRIVSFLLSVSCYNAFLACQSGNEVRAQAYRSKRHCYREWLEDLATQLVTLVAARSAPQPSQPARPVPEHDCEKLYIKRKTCRECALSRSSEDARAPATIYGCVQCNQAVHIECFGKHIRRHMQGLWQ